jgi:hypothetical protein
MKSLSFVDHLMQHCSLLLQEYGSGDQVALALETQNFAV